MSLIARLARRATRLPAAPPLICAALCLAFAAACAQTPLPRPTPPAPLPTNVTTPAPQTPSSSPTAEPLPQTSPTPAPAAQPIPIPPTPTSPPADVVFTQISVGKHHACALRENGAIACWGRDLTNEGILDAPAATGFRQISAGLNFTCALRQDATIVCWGGNDGGKADPPQGSFSEITAGGNHACALPLPQASPPGLICWGAQFPNGAETLPMDALLSSIQSGSGSTCGLTPQADMVCVRMSQRLTEITPGPFARLDVGILHVCALREDGSAFCQGDNAYLQSTPPPTKFVQIAAGWFHSCGITQALALECWGSGNAAAPGERLTAPAGEFVAISSGWRDSCALSPNGRVACWHNSQHLRLPISPPETANLPDGVSIAFGGANLNSPVDIFPWQSGGLAVVEREGVIAIHHDRPDAPPPQTILDITDSVVCCQIENGMLSATLDPQFQDFPFLYVWYSAAPGNLLGETTPGLVGRLARFRVSGGAAVESSELAILEIPLHSHAHIGGAVRFGADGMLYLGIGENGKADDAQSLNNLRGKIIRIDVRGANADQPYRIPPDNPFAHVPGARTEIWAYGLRNPWRMAFDPNNPANLFVADVGAQKWEEVSIATAGANLGWPLCEGNDCDTRADLPNLTPPALVYGRDVGCAIIGGITVPWLNDGFIFGDICARRVWLLERAAPQSWRMREIADLADSAPNILAFGAGENGNVYILSQDNPILRLDPSLADRLPATPTE